jgi:hypothetical protein
MKCSTSSKNEPPRSKIDAKIAASCNLLKFNVVLECISNITSRAADACEKGDNRSAVEVLDLVLEATAKNLLFECILILCTNYRTNALKRMKQRHKMPPNQRLVLMFELLSLVFGICEAFTAISSQRGTGSS